MGYLPRLFLIALLSAAGVNVLAQTKTVSGTVVDDANEAIIGANILVKGTTNGTITDIDGNFSLSNVADNATLQVSFLGYITQDVAVSGKTHLSIRLKEDAQALDEVVVVGYGVQKKSDVTGALVSVGAKELTARPVNNAFEALQGKAAGVDITSNERPGSLGDVRIRGVRSLSATNSPLYVVDGVPIMSESSIETINPRDIESIDILKDASATAIYGSRGANGVIIVTTKQGKEGKFSLNYAGTVSITNLVDKNPAMDASDYITYRRWAAYNSDSEKYAHPNSPTPENDEQLFGGDPYALANVMRGWAGGTWNGSQVVNTDWADFVLQTGVSHEHTISASGGTDKMNAYGSFGYLKNEGTQVGQWYERYTGKLSVNITPVKWFTFNASLNATWSDDDYGMSTLKGRASSVPDAIYGAAKAIHRYAVPYDDNGEIILQPGAYLNYTVVGETEKSTQRRQTARVLGNFAATLNMGEIWNPLKGIHYKIMFGPDFRHWREGAYVDSSSANRAGAPSWARLKNRRDYSWTLDNMITFDRSFAEKHRVSATLLQTASAWNTEESAMEAENIPRPDYLWHAFSNANTSPTEASNNVAISSGLTERQLASYMVRLNYGFNERYLATVTGRWDGASQLAPGHKWDFFPSASVAWRMDQEDFLSEVSWLDNLKLRFGFGITGNAAVSPYTTKGDITAILLPFNGMSDQLGYTFNEPYYVNMSSDGKTLANESLGWEKTAQYNWGIDFGLLGHRISGSIDAYMSRTSDLLMAMTIPTLTGFNATYANVGKTKNHGVELTLNLIPVQTQTGFIWESNLNAAYQKDEIVELAYGKNDMVDNSWFIGESLGVYYGYDNAGLWQDTPEDLAEMAKFNENGHSFEPGMVRPVDQNGDYTINAEDRVILGNKNPRWTLGWTNTFSWKNIDLGMTIYSRLGYMVDGLGNGLGGYDNINKKTDYWTPDNPNAEFQKPIYSTSGADSFSSLLGYRKASFVKIRNISLGYNFDKKLCSKIGLNDLKVYAQAVNPGSIYQSISWYDLDTNATYFNRSFVFGLEIGF
ncbi:MAG: TonB-dependent receptor [Bacteroides sp.]|nr:TonB-dependent receptor [Bacteroides sp.]